MHMCREGTASALEPNNHFVSGGIGGGIRENHTDDNFLKSNGYFDYSSLLLAPSSHIETHVFNGLCGVSTLRRPSYYTNYHT